MRLPIVYLYLIRETASLFFAILSILMAIILGFRLSNLLGRAISGNIGLDAVWRLLGFRAIDIVMILAPVACILAAVMTLSRLYHDQEISALHAGGIGRSHLIRALFSFTVPLAAVILFVSLFVLPRIAALRQAVLDQARQEASYALLDANSFRRLDDGTVIYSGEQKGDTFARLMIFQHDRTQHQARRSMILSASGHFARASDGQRFLKLDDGVRLAWTDDNAGENASYATFAHARVLLPNDAGEGKIKREGIPTLALTRRAADLGELQRRFNPALALLVFTFCIPLLAHSGPRQGRLQRLLPAFIAFAVYINVLDSFVKAIDRGRLPVWPGSLSVHAATAFFIAVWWLISGRRV